MYHEKREYKITITILWVILSCFIHGMADLKTLNIKGMQGMFFNFARNPFSFFTAQGNLDFNIVDFYKMISQK